MSLSDPDILATLEEEAENQHVGFGNGLFSDKDNQRIMLATISNKLTRIIIHCKNDPVDVSEIERIAREANQMTVELM